VSLLKTEPYAAVETMEELLAIAFAMEKDAIAAYSELADRMRRENQPELVAVFERLIGEESQHLANVEAWSVKVAGKRPDMSDLRWQVTATFDDEGASTIAPELLTAYRTFSMAVRNEERAFLFWTYVAAQTNREELRKAAERMANEELGHLATLRRERRRAFHAGRAGHETVSPAPALPELERRLADHLETAAVKAGGDAGSRLHELALRARERSVSIGEMPLGTSQLLRNGVAADVTGHLVPLCELLLDCYLDFGDHSPDEESRNRAQAFAAAAIECRSALASLPG
jgi:rubrerythrin